MNEIQDSGILALYLLAREEDAAAVTITQKHAVEQLRKLFLNGHPDAILARERLLHHADMHPLLREVLVA